MRSKALGAGAAAILIAGSLGAIDGPKSAMAQTVKNESPILKVRTGLCQSEPTFAIAAHGGSVGRQGDHSPKTEFLLSALGDAQAALAAGARALDVVEAIVVAMEDSGVFNAGKGAIANQAGVVELDASIMQGRLQNAGAVASVKAVRNPITAARMVMEQTRHVMLVGPDADRFVRDGGGPVADASFFVYGGQNFGNVPLPDDLTIAPPDAALAPDRAALLGTWGGVLEGTLNHLLVVEAVEANGAQVVYALGPHPFHGAGLYRRLTAVFVDGALQVTEPDDLSDQGTFVVTYRLNPDDTLTATAVPKGSGEIVSTLTLRRLTDPSDKHDGGTVGAAARDRCGDLAAGTSTGGYGSKSPGRVGDSPIIGAGTYADNATAAVSATGHGEFFMRHVVAFAITAAMKYKGISLEEAATGLIKRDLYRKGLRGGVVAVDKDGKVAMPYNTKGMVRGSATDRSPPDVAVY